MSASSQIGFSFQGDIAGGASLMYSASGRLLKSLSDGGIDFYAIAASVQLGRTIPITASQELMVSRLLASRGGRSGFLAKALHIGWGHSDICTELARTRAGTAALLLMSALTVGGSTFDAAVALQELFLLNGCEASMLPNVDVLLKMIRYVTPFMYNSGFNPVLQHIHGVVSKACMSRNADTALLALSLVGEPSEWAKAVKQLAFTAERRENTFLVVRQRGAWLAALAVQVLGMAVEVRVLGEILWQAPGSEGSAVFQLPPDLELSSPTDLRILYIDDPATDTGHSWTTLDCPMNEAVPTVLDIDPRITPNIKRFVHIAIYRTALSRFRTTTLVWGRAPLERALYSARMSDTLEDSVVQACVNLGVQASLEEEDWPSRRVLRNAKLLHQGLFMLDDSQLREIHQACGAHGADLTNWEHRFPENLDLSESFDLSDHDTGSLGYRSEDCLCCKIGELINSCAATAFALAPCKYNPSELRVQQQVMSGETCTDWTVATSKNEIGLLLPRMDARLPPKTTMPATGKKVNKENTVTGSQLMDHLHNLFNNSSLGGYASRQKENFNVLALSAGHITVYQKALLDNECFTPQAQVLEIATGRLSLNKVLRDIVEESATCPIRFPHMFTSQTSSWSRIAPDLEIKSHFVEGLAYAAINTSLTEDAIRISCHVSTAEGKIFDVNLSQCIDKFMVCRTPMLTSCTHSLNTPMKPESSSSRTNIVTAFWTQNSIQERNTNIFYALKGRGLEQLIQVWALPLNSTSLQVGAYLACSIRPPAGVSVPIQAGSQDLNANGLRPDPYGNVHFIMTT
ncbi:hypothetical protein MMC20_001590 [Loxospora ochrophaea]|nr:hypothetical protein [Loxospora ochrophaea]